MVVKGNAPTHRQRQALATRVQIGDAARELFARDGYVATTIAAISTAAGIPVQTIYSAMGSKAKILQDIASRSPSMVDIDERTRVAREDPDPAHGLRLAARIQRLQYEDMYDVIDAYQQAARSDPDMRRALQWVLTNRHEAFRQHVAAIRTHLSSGVTADRALDLHLALVLPEIYRTLVLERSWTPEQYEDWLTEQLIAQLLGHRAPRSRQAPH
jgi:AcrR family transcriptional regulator